MVHFTPSTFCMAAMPYVTVIHVFALCTWPRILQNGSAAMHPIEKRPHDSKSSITCSMKLTNYG
jgi:hypothetical protein